LLSALSPHTSRARIGTLVNGNTYRNPALTAKMAATVDHLSGGRFNLGLGAGWFEGEHRSLGFDFKTVSARLQALDEACQIIKSMFTQEKTTLKGKHYEVVDAVCNPRPLQKKLPLMIGGHGERVLLKIVAKHTDMWNMGNADPAEMKRLIGVIERHGDTMGRDTDEIEKTLALALCYKAPQQRQDLATQMIAMMTQGTPEQAREKMIVGGKQECIERIEGYLKAGVTHFIFMHAPPITAEEDLQAFAEDVIPVFSEQ
jgi:alkanesulfonate monooxygenase SsuD/methylene tetrahydromethanopterin reductase-like flavin-dependent oxidoreductase (luciferase family)